MNYNETLNEICGDSSLLSEEERAEAYLKCLQYARETLSDTYDYNPFMAFAADRLRQVRVRMNSAGPFVRQAGEEKVHITNSSSNGLEITGNPAGLQYLSTVFQSLSHAKMPGEHQHLFAGEPPLQGRSYGMTVYIEGDDWFEKHADMEQKGFEEEEADGEESPQRPLSDPESIKAFVWTHPQPSPGITSGKIYRVFSCRKNGPEDMTGLSYFFGIVDDEGEHTELDACLDEEDFVFFTEDDLEQLRS